MLAELAGAVTDGSPTGDAARIDRIARLERLRAVTAALQTAESVRFAQSQVAEQIAAEVHPDAIGRGIAEQIGLACRISPVAAARRLNTARTLWFELPDAYSQLVAGELHERVAETVVTETRHLNPEKRRQVQRKHRRVGVRSAPDTMAVLSGYLPVEQGIACYAALRQHADSAVATGDGRTRDQIMADTLVERITGQTTAADVNIELQLLMPLDTLINPDDHSAAVIPGYGPLPSQHAREIMTSSKARKWWRRLFTPPKGASKGPAPIVGGDPTRR